MGNREVEKGQLNLPFILWRRMPKILEKHVYFTNLNVAKHFRKVVSLVAQAQVVENILLHGVQVGIFHLDVLSKKTI